MTLRKKICPPPEPIKRYSVGTLRTPVSPVHPFVGVEIGGGGSKTNFDVAPPFDVNGSRFIIGVNGGVLIDIPGTTFSVGPRVGFLGGFGSGSTSNPAASPGFTYKVEMPWMVFYEGQIGTWIYNPLNNDPFGTTPQEGRAPLFFYGSFCAATTKTTVTGTTPGFTVTDSATRSGLTASIGIGIPLTDSAMLTGQFRYINSPNSTVYIPGAVAIDGNQWIGTIGVSWKLGPNWTVPFIP